MSLQETFAGYKLRLKNRLYGVLREREKHGDWRKYLNSIQIEFIGHSLRLNAVNWWAILGKLYAMQVMEYPAFRDTLLQTIRLIDGLEDEADY